MAQVLGVKRLGAHAGFIGVDAVIQAEPFQVATVEGGASAGETALRLTTGHLFSKAGLDLVKILDCNLRGTGRHLVAQLDFNPLKVAEIDVVKGATTAKIKTTFAGVLAKPHDLKVHILGGPPGGNHRLDYRPGAAGHVTGGRDGKRSNRVRKIPFR